MKNEQLIRAEIEKELSFLDGRPSLHDSIMQEIRGEKAVKKKLTLSLVFALVIKVAVMILGLCGFANMWMAVFADTGVAMLCVLNSIRALYRK